MLNIAKRGLSGLWMLPLLLAVLAFAASFALAPSSILHWNAKICIANCIFACLLLHVVAMICLFARKRWGKGFFCLATVPVVAFLVFVSTLTAGRSADSIRDKIAQKTRIPAEDLVCIGGWAGREAVAIFEAPDMDPSAFPDAVEQKDEPFVLRVKSRLRQFGVPFPNGGMVWSVDLGIDSLAAIRGGRRLVLVFVGLGEL